MPHDGLLSKLSTHYDIEDKISYGFQIFYKNRKPILFYKIIIHPRHASNEGRLYTVGTYAKRIVWGHAWVGIRIITENLDKRAA